MVFAPRVVGSAAAFGLDLMVLVYLSSLTFIKHLLLSKHKSKDMIEGASTRGSVAWCEARTTALESDRPGFTSFFLDQRHGFGQAT